MQMWVHSRKRYLKGNGHNLGSKNKNKYRGIENASNLAKIQMTFNNFKDIQEIVNIKKMMSQKQTFCFEWYSKLA